MSTFLSLFLLTAPLAGPLQDGAQRIAIPLHEEPSCTPDPRIPIDAEHTPGDADSLFRIDAPGSYYLPRNLTGKPGLSGIEVAASDVSIDLMGFSMTGTKLSLAGIVADGDPARVSIRNGTIAGFGGGGVDLQTAFQCRAYDVHLSANLGTGLWLGKNAVVLRCTAEGNGAHGLQVWDGSIVADSLATGNTFVGIKAGFRSYVQRCVARESGTIGISVGGKAAVIDCTASFNTEVGIHVGVSSEARGSIASWNQTHGIQAGSSSLVESCHAVGNAEYGINANGHSRFRTNRLEQNGSPGVGGGLRTTGGWSVIEDNVATNNDNVGYLVEHQGNVLRRNVAFGNTVNWAVAAGNACLVLAANAGGGVLGDTGGAAIGPDDPNANYTF